MAAYKVASGASGDVWVVLGHNRDDSFENILTNISNHSKYDNLHGMTEVSVGGDGVRLLRPLLNVSKKAIIDYARLHHIPFFTNTTPAWTQRGQIRTHVVPALDRWDPNIMEGLHQAACELRDMHATVRALVRGVDWKCIPKTDSPHFWRTLFATSESIGRVSRKSLHNFIGKTMKAVAHVPFRVVLNRGTMLDVIVTNDLVSVEVTGVADVTLSLP
ncbi:hypothetical protein FOA52_005817 [Chlamydomonas sp. UWO 241]|nr:hypothetical protein FOA52_005817 [Chlamydomonas sp. UWO 241]